MNTGSQRGFNLVELMIAITVLSVLLGIGVPSFTEMIRNNRLVAQANELVTALSFARSESLKRGIRVSACPANGAVCSGGTDWNTGILVFTDDSGTAGVLDAPNDELLQQWAPSTYGFVAGGAVSPTAVSFLPTGAEAQAQIDIYKDACTGPQVRRIGVVLTGRVGLTKVDCQ